MAGRAFEARLAQLEAALEAQQRVIEDQRREIAALRRDLRTSAPHASGQVSGGSGSGPAMGRRRAIAAGLTGAAAAGAAAVLGPASPAAAANGSAVILGSDGNSATLPTGIGVQQSANRPLYGFGVTDVAATTINSNPAVFAHAKNTNFFTAIHGQVEDLGVAVRAEAQGPGKGIQATSGTGIAGQFESSYQGGGQAVVSVTGNGPNSTGIELRAVNNLWLRPLASTPPPNSNLFGINGQVRMTGSFSGGGDVWICMQEGTPGVWRKLAGYDTAGQLHVLPAPVRVYDSRPGTRPSVGSKTKFGVNETRTFDVSLSASGGSGVPVGATAALVTMLLVNASSTAGNMTIWANGVSKPLANSVVWGGTAGRFTATATTALDAQARVQVNASQPTDLVLDVVGYYR